MTLKPTLIHSQCDRDETGSVQCSVLLTQCLLKMGLKMYEISYKSFLLASLEKKTGNLSAKVFIPVWK